MTERKKILLVDDDMLFGCIVEKTLRRAEFDVFFQNSLVAVEHVIAKLQPNLIILDVKVGQINTLERINGIKLAADGIPIIFVSAYDDLSLEQEAVTNGCVAYLEKPFKADKLVAWVKRYASDGSESSRQVRLGDCLLFMDRHAIGYPDGNERTLTRMEYETLRLLVINQGDVVGRQSIKDTVWKGVVCTDENLNNVVSRLRQYLSSDPRLAIDTVRGVGFRLTLG